MNASYAKITNPNIWASASRSAQAKCILTMESVKIVHNPVLIVPTPLLVQRA